MKGGLRGAAIVKMNDPAAGFTVKDPHAEIIPDV
jgi:hypothetical protein